MCAHIDFEEILPAISAIKSASKTHMLHFCLFLFDKYTRSKTREANYSTLPFTGNAIEIL
jgi:hypothetical protein